MWLTQKRIRFATVFNICTTQNVWKVSQWHKKNITYFTWLTFPNTFENMHSHKHRRLHAPSLFIPQRGKSSHMSPDGWARHSAPGLSLVNHKLNNFSMYSLDTICTQGYYFTQRAIGHIQFLTQSWCQLILGVVREIIIGI